MLSIVEEKSKAMSGRSLEVTRAYLQRGQAVTRSLSITLNPKHPLLKLAIAPPMAVLVLVMLILLLVSLGFILLAVVLMEVISRAGEKGGQEG